MPTPINCPTTNGTEETELPDEKNYPSPANDFLNINVENDIILNITMPDIQGKMISVEEVKDFSRLIPAHGGFLDRFDSLIAAGAWVAVTG